jgi:hypothetical protein
MPCKKGDVVSALYTAGGQLKYFRFVYSQGNGSLYYYVGETVQNAHLINAGRIGEILPTKVDMQQATMASFPSSKYVDLTLGASGTDYKAPANGFVVFRKTSGSAGKYINIYCVNGGITVHNASCIAVGSGDTLALTAPVVKGSTFTINYSATGAGLFRFVYAQGEV